MTLRKLVATLLGPWRYTQRQTDLRILWPICKRETPDLDHAKAVFMAHAMHDGAWLCLGEEEIVRRIDALT